MTLTLRPYQQKLLDDIRAAMASHRRVVAVMPTGAGKGQTIGAVVQGAVAKGRRVLVLAHRRRLISQLRRTIQQWESSGDVTVESVQTVIRRLDRIPAPDLVIIDEAHHLIQGNMWGKVVDAWPDAFLLGKTATPERLDGRGLGEGHGGYFQAMVEGPKPSWLTDQGFLAQARVFCPPCKIDRSKFKIVRGDFVPQQMEEQMQRSNIHGDAVDHYMQHVHPGTALVSCISVKRAQMMAEDYNAAGVPAAVITQGCSEAEQEHIFAALGTGEIKVVTYCEMLSEGVDVPSVTAAQLLRPTESLTMYLQQVGRALRPKPDGTQAVILDHVGNVQKHGLPADDREWSLEGKKKRKAGLSVKICPSCFTAMPSAAPVCPGCGHEFNQEQDEEEKVQQVEGELVEIKAPKLEAGADVELWFGKFWKTGYVLVEWPPRGAATVAHADARGSSWLINREHVRLPRAEQRDRREEQRQAQTLEDLIEVGQRRGMKNPRGWARHVLAARQTKGQFERVMA
jgi:DNA repair protein RadD